MVNRGQDDFADTLAQGCPQLGSPVFSGGTTLDISVEVSSWWATTAATSCCIPVAVCSWCFSQAGSTRPMKGQKGPVDLFRAVGDRAVSGVCGVSGCVRGIHHQYSYYLSTCQSSGQTAQAKHSLKPCIGHHGILVTSTRMEPGVCFGDPTSFPAGGKKG